MADGPRAARLISIPVAICIAVLSTLTVFGASTGSAQATPSAPPQNPAANPLPPPPPTGSPSGAQTMAVANVTVGDAPMPITYDSGRGEVYVGNVGDATFSVIRDRDSAVVDTGSGVGSTCGLVYDSGKGEIISSNQVSDLLNVINDTTNSAVATVSGLGNNPCAEAYDPAKGLIFVANEGNSYYGLVGDTISVVADSNNTVVANITVGYSPSGVAYDPVKGEIFVANSGSNNVSVINDTTDSVVATISLGSGPNGIVYDSGRGEVFVGDAGLSVIDPATNTVIKNVTGVSTGWQGLAYNSQKGEILALTSYQLTAVSDINYTTVATVPLGKAGSLGTMNLAFDRGNGFAYVTLAYNSGGPGKVALVSSAAYGVTFTESGLPTGGTWYVNGTSGPVPTRGWSAASGSSMTLWLINGSYSYTVASNKAYAANQSLRALAELGGSPSKQTIAFWPASRVTFHEQGLPTYFEWWTNVSGQPVVSTYFGGTIMELLPNGTYNYTVGTFSQTYDAPGGSFTVTGVAQQENLTFQAVTFAVSFNETGLPSGAEWYVNATSSPYGFSLPSTSALSGGVGTLKLINGSYTILVTTNVRGYDSNPAVLSLTESGGTPANQSVSFGIAYNMTFNETGLPSGTKWSVSIGGQYGLSGTTATLTDSLPNGTYSYGVSSSNQVYYAPGGQFAIAGAASSTSVSFGVLTYDVTFHPTGLPNSTEWYLNASSGPAGFSPPSGSAAGGTNISLSLINGSYSYSVETGDKHYTAGSEPAFTVWGNYPGEVSVPFRLYTYNASFDETGLPSGTRWQVWLNSSDGGKDYYQSGTNPALVIPAINDTYVYRIGDIPGWHINASSEAYSGNLSVSGVMPARLSVPFARVTYNFTFGATGLPGNATWYVNFTSGPSGFTPPSGLAGGDSSIVLPLANGSYTYTVATNEKQFSSAASGNLVESAGMPVNLSIAFSILTEEITFNENGLPSGATWYVNLTSGGPGGFSLPAAVGASGAPCMLNLPNGTYTYSIQTNVKAYQASGGSLTVDGTASRIAVTFTRVTFVVTSHESGLPSGTIWWMNVTGEPAQSSAGSALTEPLSNGSYTFAVSTADKTYQAPGGSFSVNGSPVTLVVTFELVTYGVSFHEYGLPSGTMWWMNVTGEATQSSVGSTLTETLSNGSYTFAVSTADKTYQAPGGSFSVTGSAVTLSVGFAPVAYGVSFRETGLASGTSWSVTLAGDTQVVTAPSSALFNKPNGTDYAYTVEPVAGYTASPSNGIVNVSGASLSVLIDFASSSGPSAPSITSFTISPTPVVNGSTVTLTVVVVGGAPPLAFQYTGLPTGCPTSNNSILHCTPTVTGSWKVTAVVTDSMGRQASDAATLTVTPAPPIPGTSNTNSNGTTLLGLPMNEGYALIAAIVVVVVVAPVAYLMIRRRASSGVPPETPEEDPPPPPPGS